MKNRSLKRAIGRRERGLKRGFGGRERVKERRRVEGEERERESTVWEMCTVSMHGKESKIEKS
jgi:hypothetical protein